MQFFLKLLILFTMFNCGTNTDTPVAFAPLIFLTNPINVPQFLGVIPTEEIPTSGPGIPDLPSSLANPNKPEFIIKYWVTNSEPQFIGYNLSITSQVPTLIETQTGTGGSIYTENGIQPSFPHLSSENSTAPENLKRRKISWRIPPPGALFFQKCEVYNFTLRALLSNVPQSSNPSVAVSSCASTNPGKCPAGSGCNPTSCSVSGIIDTSNPYSQCLSSCLVGTYCNPCTILDSAGKPKLGCECPTSVSPNFAPTTIGKTNTHIGCNR
jgi:hypothetical protein